ncbi:MAG TPA: hypothetical protein VGJ18_22795 [Gemmatimonadaceae bacterium]|jgi:hypothetical protein
MQQINCYAFVSLGIHVTACFNSAKTPLNLWNLNAEQAKTALDGLLTGNAGVVLEVSAPAAQKLREVLDDVLKMHKVDGNAVLDNAALDRFNTSVFALLNALQLELARLPTFFVTAKGVYDTRRLIEEANVAFEGYKDRLPEEALLDTNQAGRCLAFNLPTAAGFHIARATEAVIKKYMTACGCTAPRESQRNWGSYINALRAKGADDKIVHHLDQLRQLHRNPLTHPEDTLTISEAVSLWAMCVSIIQAMIADIEIRGASPSAVITRMMPPLRIEEPEQSGAITN